MNETNDLAEPFRALDEFQTVVLAQRIAEVDDLTTLPTEELLGVPPAENPDLNQIAPLLANPLVRIEPLPEPLSLEISQAILQAASMDDNLRARAEAALQDIRSDRRLMAVEYLSVAAGIFLILNLGMIEFEWRDGKWRYFRKRKASDKTMGIMAPLLAKIVTHILKLPPAP